METNELMIGDLVVFPHGIDRIVDLPYIEGRGLCASFTASATLFPVPLEQLKPIPLIAEILEKNGFKKLITYGTEKWIYGDIRMNIYSSNGCWRFCADTKRNENSVIYIHFVHELQHALRLCGIEKTIEL